MLALACLNNIAIYNIWSIPELHSTISRMQCSLHMVYLISLSQICKFLISITGPTYFEIPLERQSFCSYNTGLKVHIGITCFQV